MTFCDICTKTPMEIIHAILFAAGVVSALNIDWSSLTQDQRPTPKSGSALQRFKPANVFQRIGIEKAYAGEELFSKLKSLCQAEIEKEEVPKGGLLFVLPRLPFSNGLQDLGIPPGYTRTPLGLTLKAKYVNICEDCLIA